MTKFTYSDELFADLYKDAFGTRPTGFSCEQWDEKSPEEKQISWDTMCKILNQNEMYEKIAQEEAVTSFEKRIADTMEIGAPDRETAIRWIVDGMGYTDSELMYGGDRVAYNLNLPYNASLVKEIDVAIRNMKGEAFGRFYDEAA